MNDRWKVILGDMLATLRSLESGSVDALITDPPYSSGGAFRGDRMNDTTAKYVNSGQALQRADFAGDNRDQRSFAYWCALWLAECLRITKPGGIAAVFTDWRQLPSTTDAIQAGGWVWRGIVPWNKTEATRPQMGRPRAQCEYVVFASAGALEERKDVGVQPGWIEHPPVNPLDLRASGVLEHLKPEEIAQITAGIDLSEKVHIAGKPTLVMQQIARLCVPGGLILDPFCGSASTGVGALREGRRFLGVEVDPHWAQISRDRLSAEVLGLTLADAKAGQGSLFADPEPKPAASILWLPPDAPSPPVVTIGMSTEPGESKLPCPQCRRVRPPLPGEEAKTKSCTFGCGYPLPSAAERGEVST